MKDQVSKPPPYQRGFLQPHQLTRRRQPTSPAKGKITWAAAKENAVLKSKTSRMVARRSDDLQCHQQVRLKSHRNLELSHQQGLRGAILVPFQTTTAVLIPEAAVRESAIFRIQIPKAAARRSGGLYHREQVRLKSQQALELPHSHHLQVATRITSQTTKATPKRESTARGSSIIGSSIIESAIIRIQRQKVATRRSSYLFHHENVHLKGQQALEFPHPRYIPVATRIMIQITTATPMGG